MRQSDRNIPAILATRNPDATMHLASLRGKTLRDGTFLLECPARSTTTDNLRRDPFCWVVVRRGGLAAHDADDNTDVHLVGRGFVEPSDDPRSRGPEVIRFCPNV